MVGWQPAEGDTQAAKLGQEAEFVRGRCIVRSSPMQHGLIDEYQLMIHPLEAGIGKRLCCEDATGTTLQFADATMTPGYSVALAYQPASGPAGWRPR